MSFCIDSNFTYKVGSSSKICKSSLDYFTSNDSLNNYLSSYLVGLIEGDGSIIVSKTINNQKDKLLNPVVKITFIKKIAHLAPKITEVKKGGKIVYPKDSNYLDLLYLNKKLRIKIAVLLNGKMRTPKIEALHRLID